MPQRYPEMFSEYVARALRVALVAAEAGHNGAGQGADPHGIADDLRDRALHALSYGLRLPETWPDTSALMLKLAHPLELQGYRREWMDLLLRGVDIARTLGDLRACVQLQMYIGRLQMLLGHYDKAEQSLRASQLLAQQAGDRLLLVDTRNRLAELALHRCDLRESRRIADETLAMFAQDDPLCASSYRTLGYVAMRSGDVQTALSNYLRAMSLALEHTGDDLAVAQSLRDLGTAYIFLQRSDEALALLGRSRQISSRLGDRLGEAIVLMVYGISHWMRGEHAEAATCYDQAEPTFATYGNLIWLARNNNNRGLALQALGEYTRAETVIRTSIEQARFVNDAFETANALDTLASFLLHQGRVDEARQAWAEALHTVTQLPDPPNSLHKSIVRRLQALDVA